MARVRRDAAARVAVTAIDAPAVAAIAAAGDVPWATAPARDALTPCIVSMPAECRPRAWPLSSAGVRVISRSCCTRLAPKPAEARVTRQAATGTGGCRAKARYGTASSNSSGVAARRRTAGGSRRPTVTSPASMPRAAQANSVPAAPGA